MVLICSNCGWKVDKGLFFLFKNLSEYVPPCSVCESVMEGFRIL